MARIAGVELDENLKIDYALTKIRGIGWGLSKRILSDTGIGESKRISQLTAGELTKITSKVEEFPVEGDLSRKVASDINRLKVISSYRGLRHQKGLPVRGQRTRTNARTKRGKRRTVGAFKKEMLSKKEVDTKKEAAVSKGGK
ncbi:MAG: 30S ribosomal protein S13 [Patescibacteria group bacterium]